MIETTIFSYAFVICIMKTDVLSSCVCLLLIKIVMILIYDLILIYNFLKTLLTNTIDRLSAEPENT